MGAAVPRVIRLHSAFRIPHSAFMSYTVALDSFHGPLDLLLYLVRRNEVDVHDIPVSELTAQFLEYLRVVRELDVELAGDFLVMAATLCEIKSRALLPAEAAADAAEPQDPRRELVRQLLEYRKYKDAAAALEKAAEVAARRVPRQPEAFDRPDAAVRPVELWDLVSAFARLMRETQAAGPTVLAADDTPQEVYEARVAAAVRAAGRINFRDLFEPPYRKATLLGLFLAVLELIKRRAVWAEQPEPFGEIWLVVPVEDPATPG
jgi:segregation and condensation protein A